MTSRAMPLLVVVLLLIVLLCRVESTKLIQISTMRILPAARSAEMMLRSSPPASRMTMLVIVWSCIMLVAEATTTRGLTIVSSKTVIIVKPLLLGRRGRVSSLKVTSTVTVSFTVMLMVDLMMITRVSILFMRLLKSWVLLITTIVKADVFGKTIPDALILLVAPGHALISAFIRFMPFCAVEALCTALASCSFLRLHLHRT